MTPLVKFVDVVSIEIGAQKGKKEKEVDAIGCLGLLVLFWFRTRGSVARAASSLAFGMTSQPQCTDG